MTQQESVLDALVKAYPRGLTTNDLHDQLKIAKNTLTTVMWELRKDDLITRIGGKRGSYIYTITKKGRDDLKERRNDLVVPTEMLSSTDEGYMEVMKMVENVRSLKELRKFTDHIVNHSADRYCLDPDELKEALDEDILDYLNIDREEFEKQRDALEIVLATL